MKKLSLVLGLSLLLAACGASEEGAEEDNGTSNSGKTNSEEMNEENSGSMNDSGGKKSEDEKSSAGEGESNAADSLMVEILGKVKENENEGHHGSDVSIMLENYSGNPQELTAIVEDGNNAIEGASVRFEYWKEGEEKHIYTDAEEVGTGEYRANIEILDAGTYNMKVHVEKGEDLHAHKPYTLDVTMEQSS